MTATGLPNLGATVTLLSTQTPEQYRSSAVLSSQSLFRLAPRVEESLRLRDTFPDTPVSPGADPTIQGSARLKPAGSSIDQRDVKFKGLLQFAKRGGRIERPDAESELGNGTILDSRGCSSRLLAQHCAGL